MYTETIKTKIEQKTQEIVESSPLLLKAKAGTLTRDEVIYYLHNLRYVFEKTPGYLRTASRRAQELGYTELSTFYAKKAVEETGHDGWAKADLEKQGADLSKERPITPSAIALMNYTEGLVNDEPHLYLSYMAFVEYFTVLASPDFLKDLEENCGIYKQELTAVLNHQISDQDHIQEDLEIMGALIQSPSLIQQLLDVIDHSSNLVKNTLKECTTQ